MTPQQWAEGIGAGSMAAIGLAITAVVIGRKVVAAWRALMTEVGSLRAELDAAKTQATAAAQQSATAALQSTTAAQQSTAAATSAAKVDDSIHVNNSGHNLKDFTDDVRRRLRDLQLDVGGIREELRHLNGVDLADRQAAAEVHAAHDRRLDALERRDRP